MFPLGRVIAPFGVNLLRLSVFTAVSFAVIWLSEWWAGARIRRYGSHNFAHDAIYWFYYLSGLHNALFTSVLYAWLGPRFHLFQFNLVNRLPVVPRFLIYLLVTDFIAYWYHRWKHSNRFLWAFHSMHHSQEQLNLFTISRGHPVEQVLGALVIFIPLQILGSPPPVWFPFVFLRQLLEASQHSDLKWSFGPFYRIIVSPRFHAFHHSVKPEHYNTNFGINLSIWDFVFGTDAQEEDYPSEFGLVDLKMPTLRAQLVRPFRLAWRSCFNSD